MKRYAFPLTIILLLITVVALAAPGDKRPAVTSAAIGLGTSSSATLASVTATTSVTAPSFNSTAADGYHYILPYNSTAFAGTPSVGMFVTTPTGPQWYTGSEWEAIGGAGDSLPSQTGNSGKYLTTNGTAASWGTIAAGSGIAISADIPTETGAANLNDTTGDLIVATSTGYWTYAGTKTAWDTTPAAFAFTDETDVALSTAKTSNAITVAGTNYPAAISVTGDTGYGYSKNSAACTATSGTVVAGNTVAACVTSSGSNSTATTATITIGGVSDTYSVTTAAGQASSWDPARIGTDLVLSNSNLTAATTPDAWASTLGTISKTSGKWYWEVTIDSMSSGGVVGIGSSSTTLTASFPGADDYSYGYYQAGSYWHNASTSGTPAGFSAGAVIGIALDLDAGTLEFYKNGVSQGVAATGLIGTFYPAVGVKIATVTANFGATSFAYTPPSGFSAIGN